MLKRTISGAVYCAIVVGFFLLRAYVRAVAFDAFLWFLCAFGSFELARALKDYELPGGFWVTVISGAVLPVIYVVAEHFLNKWNALYITLGVIGVIALSLLIVKLITKDTFKKWGVTVFTLVYPFLGVLSMMILNDVNGQAGVIGLYLIFIIPATSDTFAYLFGMLYNKIRKGKALRLAPNLSPKKTWAGAVAGAVGGALAGLLVYVVFKPVPRVASPLFIFIFVGFIASIVGIFGDLFESYIKRSVGIKDMGKIMPGHGGVLDRIDSMLFIAPYILLMMVLM